MTGQSAKTPLLDLARAVPPDFVGTWETQWMDNGFPCGHQTAPVGKYVHDLADKLESATAEIQQWRDVFGPMYERGSQAPFGTIHMTAQEYFALGALLYPKDDAAYAPAKGLKFALSDESTDDCALEGNTKGQDETPSNRRPPLVSSTASPSSATTADRHVGKGRFGDALSLNYTRGDD